MKKTLPQRSSADIIRQTAQELHASALQKELLEAWLACVFEVAAMDYSTVLGAALTITADMTSLRASVATASASAIRLTRAVLQQCGVPSPAQIEAEKILDLTQQCRSHKVELWCDLTEIGSSTPKADLGYSVRGRIAWSLADVWMPQSADQDAVRDYCLEDRRVGGATVAPQRELAPSALGGSLLLGGGSSRPRRRSLDFETTFDSVESGVSFGLGFFKALGFEQPTDALVKALHESQPSRTAVRIVMGDDGASEIEVGFSSTTKLALKNVSQAFGFRINEEALNRVWSVAGGGYESAAVLQLVANATGIVPAVGFRLMVAK